MATDLEKLVVQLSMEMRQYDKTLRRVADQTNKQFGAIEKRARQMNKNLDVVFSRTMRNFATPLAGVGAALGTREVLQYADAWTSAKNSLAVAGVVGDRQKTVLDQLYASAQANAAPITALTDLYGKAAQASDNLGASQAEMLKFSDGVAVALRVAGTSAGAASGALTQLGQLLGQARVQAEEFNSVNEGARPILMAVANGIDEAGGSVSKLKQLVTDGKVSGQQFFQAFLKGLPTIQSMAANATQTIEQGITKVNNAFTKYIGESDESLGASQRLVQALNALADNFGETADVVLNVAGVIAGALVGRSIAGMIRSLGVATTATYAFLTAIKSAAGAGTLVKALGGIGAAAGPIGMVVGGAVVTALTLFTSSSASASDGAQAYASALKEVKEAAEKVPAAVSGATSAIDEKSRSSNTEGLVQAKKDLEETTQAIVDMFEHLERNADTSAVSDKQLQELENIRQAFEKGTASAENTKQAIWRLANSNPDFKAVANTFDPLLSKITEIIGSIGVLENRLNKMGSPEVGFRELEDKSMEAYRQMKATSDDFIKDAQRRNSLSKDQLALETEIARVRKDAEKAGATLTEKQIKELAAANIAADTKRSAEGKKPKKEKQELTAEQKFGKGDLQNIADRTAALIAETEAMRQLNPTIDDYGLAMEKARTEQELLNAAQQAGAALTPELRAQIAQTAEQWALATAEANQLAEAQDKIRQRAEEWQDAQQGAVRGVVDDLIAGKSAAEAFAGALQQLLDKLLDFAFDGRFTANDNWLKRIAA